MINTTTLFDNHALSDYQEQQQLKIQELQATINSLKEEIEILKEIHNPIYDV